MAVCRWRQIVGKHSMTENYQCFYFKCWYRANLYMQQFTTFNRAHILILVRQMSMGFLPVFSFSILPRGMHYRSHRSKRQWGIADAIRLAARVTTSGEAPIKISRVSADDRRHMLAMVADVNKALEDTSASRLILCRCLRTAHNIVKILFLKGAEDTHHQKNIAAIADRFGYGLIISAGPFL